LLLLLISYCIPLNCQTYPERVLAGNLACYEFIEFSNGETRMKKSLFLLLVAGGMMFAASTEVQAHQRRGHRHGYNHSYGYYGHSGYRHRRRGISIGVGRGYGGYGGYGYGYPARRSYGVSYGYSPRSYFSVNYGGGYYRGGRCRY
jgi:hypothetical protein